MPLAICLRRDTSDKGYHPLELKEIPNQTPKSNEVVVRIAAAALNHRDLFQRQNLYPAISFSNPILADGVGVILKNPNSSGGPSPGTRVLINPGTGWVSDPKGPEKPYTVLGGTATTPLGTLTEQLALAAEDVVPCPEHLTDAEAAALPLAGLTAWRAFASKSDAAEAGRNVLVTGIGGGVALFAMQFAVAKGCNVYVSSSSAEKINKAKELGAKGGVNYKEKNWVKTLGGMLPKSRPYLDAVIDGAGGNIVQQVFKILGHGSVVVSYGITTLKPPAFPMQAVMRNVDLRGSTMGSRREFADMVRFVGEKKIKPVVSMVVDGIRNLDGIDALFDEMNTGKQFGKLVVRLNDGQKSKL